MKGRLLQLVLTVVVKPTLCQAPYVTMDDSHSGDHARRKDPRGLLRSHVPDPCVLLCIAQSDVVASSPAQVFCALGVDQLKATVFAEGSCALKLRPTVIL